MGWGMFEFIIPMRFLTMISHFIAVIMIFYTKGDNIRTAIDADYSSAEFNDAKASIDAALGLSVILLIVELLGLLSGISMFSFLKNIASHFTATICLSFFIMDRWHYITYWWMFAFLNVPSAVMEVLIIISTLILKRKRY